MAKLISITLEGCPSAAARFISLPSPRTFTILPFSRVCSSTKGLIVLKDFVMLFNPSRSSSTLKCPEFAIIAPCFIMLKWLFLITFILPVTVQKISPILAALLIGITLKPSITASRAAVGSTSVIITFAPIPFARIARPFPHHP